MTEEKKSVLSANFKTIVTVLMAITSLWVATIVRIQNDVGLYMSLAIERSRAESVAAFGELTRADQRVTHGLDIYSAFYDAEQQALRAELDASAARLNNDTEKIFASENIAARWGQLQDHLSGLTPLLSDEYEGDYASFYEESHREAYYTYQLQQAYEREAAIWRTKAGNYRDAMAMLSVTLFLYGMSLNINNWVRYLFAIGAFALELITVFIVVNALRQSIAVTPPAAIDQFVEGQITSNIAYTAPPDSAAELNATAIDAFNAAIQLDQSYADAYQWRGYTTLQTRLLNADPQQNAQAADDMQKAIEFGNTGSVVYTNLGWAYTLAGEYTNAISALETAIEAEPTECTARINLGLALMADSQSDASAQAYDGAIACLLEESPDEQANLLATAILDLSDLQAQAPNTPHIDNALLHWKETAASVALLGEITPQEHLGKVEQVLFAGGIAADGSLIDADNTFAAGTPSIYTLIEFSQMSANTPWMVRWYQNGELFDQYIADSWSGDTTGLARLRIKGAPIPTGKYQADVFIAGNLVASEVFEIEAGETLPMHAYVSGFFRISINHPVEWYASEDHTANNYLYITNPEDDDTFFWYTSYASENNAREDILANLMILWFSQHPDLSYGEQGEFFLGGLALASYMPVTYTNQDGNSIAALLVGMADGAGNAYALVMQAPETDFDQTYQTVFTPMLHSLWIAPVE